MTDTPTTPPTPATEDDAVEKAARAIHRQHIAEGADDVPWEGEHEEVREAFRRDARAALSALADPEVLQVIAEVLSRHKTEWRGDWPNGHFCSWCCRDVEWSHQAEAVVAALTGAKP